MRKSGSAENKMRRTRARLISWRPPREGMRKTGSPEKRSLQFRRSVALRFPGTTDIEGHEEKWFRNENMPGSFFIAELERPPEIPGRGSFVRNRKVEEPAK